MAFVVSAGQVAAVARPAPPPALAVTLGDGIVQDYATLWRSQPHLRTVVDFLARNIAQLGLHTYRRLSDTDRERLTGHPVARLLARPNPWTTTYRWVESLVSDLAIYDNAVHVKVAAEGQPRSLLRLDPAHVTPIGDNPFVPDGYEFRGNKGKRQFPADQVVHWRGYNAESARWGASPIETLRQILLEEYQASKYREQLWRNQARMSGYIERPREAPNWSDTAKRRFRAQWQAQYVGDGPQAGGTPILEDGMTFKQVAVSPEAAQYIESRKLTREEVTAAYHIPLPMVGILDHATYSNVTQQHKQMYQDTLGPWLEMLQQEMELQLLPDFREHRDIYLEFNLAEKLRGSFEEQAQQLQTSVGAPYMTRNEGRARLNLPSIDGGDELVTPLNVIIGGQASPTDSAPPAGTEPKDALPPLRRVKARDGQEGGRQVNIKTCSVSIKAAGTQDGTDDGVFEAIVATWDLDSVGDRIVKGAFADSLANWSDRGDPIPVVWSHMAHDPDYHIGVVEEIEERDDGLWVKGRIDTDAPKAAQVYRLLKGRRVTQFSFAYDVVDGGFARSDGEDEFELRKLRLYEVGPTLIGANQQTELLSVKSAIRSHSTETSDEGWDGPANEARLDNDADAATYRKAFAWADPNGDADSKDSYRFIHHYVDSDGNVGAASLKACRTGIGVLNGGRGGSTIPDADREGVYRHLAKHIRDAGEDPPELKARETEPVHKTTTDEATEKASSSNQGVAVDSLDRIIAAAEELKAAVSAINHSSNDQKATPSAQPAPPPPEKATEEPARHRPASLNHDIATTFLLVDS